MNRLKPHLCSEAGPSESASQPKRVLFIDMNFLVLPSIAWIGRLVLAAQPLHKTEGRVSKTVVPSIRHGMNDQLAAGPQHAANFTQSLLQLTFNGLCPYFSLCMRVNEKFYNK